MKRFHENNDNIENKKKRKILRGSISVEREAFERGGLWWPAEKVQMRGSFWGKGKLSGRRKLGF